MLRPTPSGGKTSALPTKVGGWITFLRQSQLPTRSMILTFYQTCRSAIIVQLALY
uniref:Uncharacterized protein n=1 Tax=Arundo donax TaxID=35708 RepID=A0A0A9H769_ARUDO